MFQWIDMRVTLLRLTKEIIKSLIPPEDRDQVGNAPSNYNNCLTLNGVIQTCQTEGLQHSTDILVVPFKRLTFCQAGLDEGIKVSRNGRHSFDT